MAHRVDHLLVGHREKLPLADAPDALHLGGGDADALRVAHLHAAALHLVRQVSHHTHDDRHANGHKHELGYKRPTDLL